MNNVDLPTPKCDSCTMYTINKDGNPCNLNIAFKWIHQESCPNKNIPIPTHGNCGLDSKTQQKCNYYSNFNICNQPITGCICPMHQ